jgi:hypothetical protein
VTVGRLVALIGLTAVAVVVAVLLQRRRPDPPSAPSYRAPSQLDRDDFVNPSLSTLIALFASTTCHTCPKAWDAVLQAVAERNDGDIATQRIDVQDNPDLHTRYRIDGVPTTLVVDADGVVTQAFFGPVTSRDVAEALPV